MATDNNVVSVGITATRLDTVADQGDRKAGESITIYNDGAATVYIGGASVTASGAKKGAPVPAASWGPGLDLGGDDGLYGIVASGTVNVIVLETGV